jgi:nucleotide-binding universal stress UspA family protein/YHS domain-containing protein
MAMELLAQHRLELMLLHVAPDLSHADTASLALSGAAQRLSASPAEVKPILTFGRPEVEIARYADQHGADLIAMSTHGRSMLARMLVGSVTDRVIRTAPVPVLVMHPPTMSLGRVSPPAGRKLRILAPYDGSTFAAEAIVMSVSLLRPEHIEVEMLTTVVVPDLQTLARQLLEQTANRLREQGVVVNTSLVFGDAAPAITKLAHEGGFDLLVMSTHGSGMLARALIGSTTDKLVRTSEVPVLVVQPQAMEVPADPVSGEALDPDTAQYTSVYHERIFAFTSLEHKQQFDGAPEAYIGNRLARPRGFTRAEEGMAPVPTSPVANGG